MNGSEDLDRAAAGTCHREHRGILNTGHLDERGTACSDCRDLRHGQGDFSRLGVESWSRRYAESGAFLFDLHALYAVLAAIESALRRRADIDVDFNSTHYDDGVGGIVHRHCRALGF